MIPVWFHKYFCIECFQKDFSERYKPLLLSSLKITWPMIIIMLFEFFVNITDVFIAGKLGKEVQASVGFVTQFYFIFLVIANSVSIGSVAVISRIYGMGDREKLKSVISTLFIFMFSIGVIVSIIAWFISPAIIANLKTPDVIKGYSIELLRFYIISMMFHFLMTNTNAVFRATGRVVFSMKSMMFVSIANIVLNYIFVFKTPLGFKGIAASTALSIIFGTIINLIYIIKKIGFVSQYDQKIIKKIMQIALPSGVLQIAWHIGSMVLFIIIGLIPGNKNVEYLAAFTNGLRIESAIFLPAFAFNMSTAAFVGNLLGEKKDKDAFTGALVSSIAGVGVIIVLSLIVILSSSFLASVLSENFIVMEETRKYLVISMIGEPFMAWSVILAGAMAGAGDTKSIMKIVSLTMWCIRIPLCYIIGVYFEIGILAVWWMMNFSILVRAIFMTRRFFSRRWITYEN